MDQRQLEQLEEVSSFLAPIHRNEVRLAAVEVLSSFAADEKLHADLVGLPGLSKSLALICADAGDAFTANPSLCKNALEIVVNLSTSEAGRKALLEVKFVSRIVDFFDTVRRLDWKKNFKTGNGAEALRLSFMVLNNLTVDEEGQIAMLQIGSKLEGLFLLKLLKFVKELLEQESIDTSADLLKDADVDVLEYVPAVLTNLTQHILGRTMLLDEKRQIFPLFVQLLNDEAGEGEPNRTDRVSQQRHERRMGALRLIRNCAFEQGKHDYLLQEEFELVGILVKPLILPGLIDLSEWDKLPEQIKKRWGPVASDVSKEEVMLIIDIFDVLVRKNETRARLRKLNVYVVFREYDNSTQDEELTNLLYDLVHWFILDEDEQSSSGGVTLEGDNVSPITV
eukprot:TRINITY_DN1191_c0_g1_i1.p1 TRINITY_DN1191_c0_g1~~TRINITY_DN1191_c0_g1_i1.p1  ORF type:complete len:395 (+),score=127.31 TRINITY_DN1191_c0_g1_i1:55-1239(+)